MPLAPRPHSVRSAIAGVVWPGIPSDPGAALIAQLFQLDQSQWWPGALLRERQSAQLAIQFDFLWEKSPWHRARLEAAGFAPGAWPDEASWRRLPILRRSEVQSEFAALSAHGTPKAHGRLLEFSTTGSQGTPVRVLGNELSHLFASSLTVRAHLWHHHDLSGKFAAIRTKVRSQRLPDWGIPVAAAFHTGPSAVLDIATDIDGQLDWLRDENPAYLLTHPSNLRALLQRAEERAVTVPGLRELMSFGEMLPDDLRTLARRVWGLAVVDQYSCEECGPIALQCPEHPDRYHVHSENLLVEVVDDAGEPCPAGTIGRVLVSTLHNFSMPLLRYEIGDCAAMGEACPCGRGLPVLSRIAGRQRNMITLPDGRRRWPSFPSRRLLEVATFKQIQIVQRSASELEVRLARGSPLPDNERSALEVRLDELLGAKFSYRFSYADNLNPSGGGKFEDFLGLANH